MKYLEEIFKKQKQNIVKYIDEKYILNSKYKIGKVNLSNKIALLDLGENKNQKIFIELDKLNGAYQNDIVLVQVLFNPKGKTKAKVVDILESSDNEILLYYKDNSFYTIKENIQISIDTKEKLSNEDIVIAKNKDIVKVVGNIKYPKIDEIISFYLYHQSYRLDEFKKYSYKATDTQRVDLTHLDFCTIDPVSAKDHDDAIYFDKENSELYIAIADVSAFVQDNSELDKEALKRGFSIYLPHKVLPMLPFELSTNLCSLVPNQKRYAYVFKLKLDLKSFTVIKSELFEATIESKNKFSYEYIDEVLKENNPDNEYVNLYNITKKFREKRLKKGFDFRNDEIRLILDHKEELKDFRTETSSPSHSLVEECMLLANKEGAKRLKLLGIYRTHDEPSQSKIKKLLDDVTALGLKVKLKADVHSTILDIQQKAKNYGLEQEVDELIIQSQQQAKYSSVKNQHFGLGFDDYSHFTSPIRRYSDLVLHRMLKTHKIPKNIEDICEDISIKERDIATLVWDYEDRKYARYFSNYIGDIFDAKIIDVETPTVKIEDSRLEGARAFINNEKNDFSSKLFSKVKVKILSSDIISKRIDVKIV